MEFGLVFLLGTLALFPAVFKIMADLLDKLLSRGSKTKMREQS
jgi:hypothetical protein